MIHQYSTPEAHKETFYFAVLLSAMIWFVVITAVTMWQQLLITLSFMKPCYPSCLTYFVEVIKVFGVTLKLACVTAINETAEYSISHGSIER